MATPEQFAVRENGLAAVRKVIDETLEKREKRPPGHKKTTDGAKKRSNVEEGTERVSEKESTRCQKEDRPAAVKKKDRPVVKKRVNQLA